MKSQATGIIVINHRVYINILANFVQPILYYVTEMNTDRGVPVYETLIPLGVIKEVKGTTFNFSEPKTEGEKIEREEEQWKKDLGYDQY